MKCHTHNSVFIPGCMGAAAALSGGSISLAKSRCTCEIRDEKDKLVERVERLEWELEELKHELSNT